MTEDPLDNFRDDIIEAAAGEDIEAAAIGHYGWCYGHEDRDHNSGRCPPDDVFGKPLPWDEAAPLLDYTYDTGYGGPECHAVTVWTTDRVLFVTQYDGSTAVDAVPRNPVEAVPTMPGG